MRNPDGLYSDTIAAVIRGCDAAGVKRVVVLTADYDASRRTPESPAPWFYRSVAVPLLYKRLYTDIRLFEDWASVITGMDFGRPLHGEQRQSLRRPAARSLASPPGLAHVQLTPR